MKRLITWFLIVLVLLVLLLVAGAWGLQRWLGTDDFRQRIEQQASVALGVGVKLGRIDVALWPLPALALDELALQTKPAITVARLEVRPAWLDLLRGRLAPDSFILRKAVLPQVGLDAVLAALQKKKRDVLANKHVEPDSSKESVTRFLPKHTEIDDLTWVNAQGVAMTLAAQADLSADALPQSLRVQIVKGRFNGTQLELVRQDVQALAWAVVAKLGGGSIKGRMAFSPSSEAGAALVLDGRLQTKDVELSALLASPAPMSGRLEAATTLSARSPNLGALAQVLQTQTQFTVHQAVVHGLDLAKAVKTVGTSRGGQTPLDILTGGLVTQGKAVQLNKLVASSGLLSASGQVAISPAQALSGRISVELGATVGVPLVLGGTVSEPDVSLSRAALTGAASALGDRASQGLKNLFSR